MGVSERQRRVSLRFEPDAIDVKSVVDSGGVEYLACNPNLIRRITAADYSAVYDAAIVQLKATAESLGIREQTRAEAKQVLTAFLGQLGYEVQIEFADVQAPASPTIVVP